jgi:hypothetical protein
MIDFTPQKLTSTRAPKTELNTDQAFNGTRTTPSKTTGGLK